jgi:uncharacterized membrane protein
VEVAEGGHTARYQFNCGMDGARVFMEEGRVVLRDAKEELEIGRHLGVEGRAQFAAELEKMLIRGRTT